MTVIYLVLHDNFSHKKLDYGLLENVFFGHILNNLPIDCDFIFISTYNGRRLYQYNKDDFGFHFSLILNCLTSWIQLKT